MQLSPTQVQVVNARGHHIQVIACAGSGKTESISRRVASLISEGVRSDQIVAFTFTERAATELKERIVRRVGEIAGAEAAGKLAQMYVGTIHGYCLRLLQDHLPAYGNFDIVDEHRHAALLFRFRKEIGLASLAPKVWESVLAFARTSDVISNENISLTAVDRTDFGTMYRTYLGVLDRLHILTYARIIQCAVVALDDTELRRRVAGGLKHLIVDEYQDINPSQFQLIRQLASEGAQVCVVGDDDQAIYQWRGSSVTYIQQFANHFPGAQQLILNENRRSLAPIVHSAAAFAQTIAVRIEKRMHPTRANDEPVVVPFRAMDAAEEADAVTDNIMALNKQGVRFSDIAILFRSVRTSTKPFIDACTAKGIPVTCGGRSGLFMQPEIQAVLKAHLWLADQNWWDPETRTETELTVNDVAAELQRAFRSVQSADSIADLLQDWRAIVLSTRVAANLIGDYYTLIEFLGVREWNIDDSTTLSRMGALARFSTILADFENITRRGRYEVGESGAREFRGGTERGLDYYQRLAGYLRYYAQDNYEEFEGEEGTGVEAVQVLTVHGAKGLEWPVVFMPSLQDRRFPASRAGRQGEWCLPNDVMLPEVKQRYAGGDEEERRLFYVAMTRARDILYLSHFDKTDRQRSKRSRFIDAVLPNDFPAWSGPVIPIRVDSRQVLAAKPVAISLTELIRYEDCGYRFRLQRSMGFESQLVSELGFGRAIHHVLRRIADEARSTNRIPDLARVEQILEGDLYFPFANKSIEPLMKQKARAVIVRYLNNHRDDLERIWATERPFELHLPQGFLSGRADVILDQEGGNTGSLAIVDYKSASDGTSDENYRFQLQVYSAAARAEGLDVRGAYLHDLAAKTAPRSPVDIGNTDCGAALKRIEGLLGDLAGRSFAARPAVDRCRRCELKAICQHRAAGC